MAHAVARCLADERKAEQMAGITSKPALTHKSDPVRSQFAFAGLAIVSTQIAPASTRLHRATRQVHVRFSSSSAVIDHGNAYEALRFAQYLASQAKFVLDGGAT